MRKRRSFVLRGWRSERLLVLVLAWGVSSGAVLHAASRWQSVLVQPDVEAAWARDFALLESQIAAFETASPGALRLEQEVLSRQALILRSDRDPAAVVLRRTRALLAFLVGSARLSVEQFELDALARESESVAVEDKAQRAVLYGKVCAVRRRIAFKNPLLDFDQLLFLTRHRPIRGDHHMVDQYYGFNARPGGSVYALDEPFGRRPRVRDLLADERVRDGRLRGKTLTGGAFHTLDLDYDGKSILFAWCECGAPPAGASWEHQPWSKKDAEENGKPYYFWLPETTYHIYRARSDGERLTQLTDCAGNEFAPCFLPNRRILFVSERQGGFLSPEGRRPMATYTLYSMEDDGSDATPLSYRKTQEWNPRVNNEGMIVYTRWDYVGQETRDDCQLWTCYPDGQEPRSLHAKSPRARESRPWMEFSARAIPNSGRYVAVAAPQHGYSYGSLVLIDLAGNDDGAMNRVRRITPEALFPESEKAPGVPHRKGTHSPRGEVYGSPWPLSENFYLCVYDPDQTHYGIYLIDCFGNRELVYRDPNVACLDPIPLRKRPLPPVVSVPARGP